MIEFKNVTKAYPKSPNVLNGIDLKINDGEFVFVMGESGAGKTTLMKLLLREEKITSGSLTVDGYNLKRLAPYKVPKYRRNLGVVFQDFRLFPTMTVYENVAFAMRVVGASGRNIRKMVPHVLKIVGLEGKEGRKPKELSGGEQQRVALARALVNNPSIIIADEPTGNIDPKMSLNIMNLLVKINRIKPQKTVIVVTHEKGLVDYYKDVRVIRLEGGRVISDTKPPEGASL